MPRSERSDSGLGQRPSAATAAPTAAASAATSRAAFFRSSAGAFHNDASSTNANAAAAHRTTTQVTFRPGDDSECLLTDDDPSTSHVGTESSFSDASAEAFEGYGSYNAILHQQQQQNNTKKSKQQQAAPALPGSASSSKATLTAKNLAAQNKETADGADRSRDDRKRRRSDLDGGRSSRSCSTLSGRSGSGLSRSGVSRGKNGLSLAQRAGGGFRIFGFGGAAAAGGPADDRGRANTDANGRSRWRLKNLLPKRFRGADDDDFPVQHFGSATGSVRDAALAEEKRKAQLQRTWDGVFLPVSVSAFGVVLFLKLPWVIGQCGLLLTVLLVFICYAISGVTTVAVAAISTNGIVGDGGPYVMVSRCLGPVPGLTIATSFTAANIAAAALYMNGAAPFALQVIGIDVFVKMYADQKYLMTVATSSAFLALLFVIALFRLANIFRLGCLAATLIAIIDIVVSIAQGENHAAGVTGLKLTTFHANLWPQFEPDVTIYQVMGVLFPGVTGIMSGMTLSGQIRHAAKAIPRGIGYAWVVSLCVYLLLTILLAGAFDRGTLQTQTGVLLNATHRFFFGPGALISCFAVCLSSIVGSNAVLMGVARDGVLPGAFWEFFAKRDRRLCLALCWLLLQLAVLATGTIYETVSSITSLIFLVTFAALNLGCLVSDLTGVASFRPLYRFFNTPNAVIGIIASIVTMFFINPLGASVILLLLVILYFFVDAQLDPTKVTWGDAMQPLTFFLVRKWLLKLDERKEHLKHWRPSLLHVVTDVHESQNLIHLANNLKKGGLYEVLTVLGGDFDSTATPCHTWKRWWIDFIAASGLKAFGIVTFGDSLRSGLQHTMRGVGLGGMRPNTVLLSLDELERKTGFREGAAALASFGVGLSSANFSAAAANEANDEHFTRTMGQLANLATGNTAVAAAPGASVIPGASGGAKSPQAPGALAANRPALAAADDDTAGGVVAVTESQRSHRGSKLTIEGTSAPRVSSLKPMAPMQAAERVRFSLEGTEPTPARLDTAATSPAAAAAVEAPAPAGDYQTFTTSSPPSALSIRQRQEQQLLISTTRSLTSGDGGAPLGNTATTARSVTFAANASVTLVTPKMPLTESQRQRRALEWDRNPAQSTGANDSDVASESGSDGGSGRSPAPSGQNADADVSAKGDAKKSQEVTPPLRAAAAAPAALAAPGPVQQHAETDDDDDSEHRPLVRRREFSRRIAPSSTAAVGSAPNLTRGRARAATITSGMAPALKPGVAASFSHLAQFQHQQPIQLHHSMTFSASATRFGESLGATGSAAVGAGGAGGGNFILPALPADSIATSRRFVSAAPQRSAFRRAVRAVFTSARGDADANEEDALLERLRLDREVAQIGGAVDALGFRDDAEFVGMARDVTRLHLNLLLARNLARLDRDKMEARSKAGRKMYIDMLSPDPTDALLLLTAHCLSNTGLWRRHTRMRVIDLVARDEDIPHAMHARLAVLKHRRIQASVVVLSLERMPPEVLAMVLDGAPLAAEQRARRRSTSVRTGGTSPSVFSPPAPVAAAPSPAAAVASARVLHSVSVGSPTPPHGAAVVPPSALRSNSALGRTSRTTAPSTGPINCSLAVSHANNNGTLVGSPGSPPLTSPDAGTELDSVKGAATTAQQQHPGKGLSGGVGGGDYYCGSRHYTVPIRDCSSGGGAAHDSASRTVDDDGTDAASVGTTHSWWRRQRDKFWGRRGRDTRATAESDVPNAIVVRGRGGLDQDADLDATNKRSQWGHYEEAAFRRALLEPDMRAALLNAVMRHSPAVLDESAIVLARVEAFTERDTASAAAQQWLQNTYTLTAHLPACILFCGEGLLVSSDDW